MPKKEKVVIPVEEVPEVLELLQTERELQALINSNPEFYKKLTALAATRNQLLSAAESKVKDLGVSCGPFNKLSETQKIDAEKLFEELGDEAFKDFGGYTETVVSYKVDRTRFLSYLQSGAIPKEVSDACVKNEQRYKKPDPYNMP